MLHVFNLETNKTETLEKAKINNPETILINILVYYYLDIFLYKYAVIYSETTKQ